MTGLPGDYTSPGAAPELPLAQLGALVGFANEAGL